MRVWLSMATCTTDLCGMRIHVRLRTDCANPLASASVFLFTGHTDGMARKLNGTTKTFRHTACVLSTVNT